MQVSSGKADGGVGGEDGMRRKKKRRRRTGEGEEEEEEEEEPLPRLQVPADEKGLSDSRRGMLTRLPYQRQMVTRT